MIFSWSKWFITHRKQLEEVDFDDEAFQHKKTNNKNFYIGLWCTTEDIPEDACS